MPPEISVVVRSGDRPLRRRWLMNALEDQTLDRSLWELCVDREPTAPVVVTIDEGCRPPPDWLENVRDAVARHPGSAVQGALRHDPREHAMWHSPYPRVRPALDADTNVAYPRAGAGKRVPDDQMLVYCSVEEGWAWTRVADAPRVAEWHPRLALLPLALVALVLAPRRPAFASLALPWALLSKPRRGGIRGRIRHLLRLPAEAAVDAADLLALIRRP